MACRNKYLPSFFIPNQRLGLSEFFHYFHYSLAIFLHGFLSFFHYFHYSLAIFLHGFLSYTFYAEKLALVFRQNV